MSVTRNIPTQPLVPTQNTAPVLKFQCLYSYDLRRKAKRWQDGFLRFHTFNKRAMVYDVAGNFIGDSHWRKSEVIQEGDELELDKGVLIQVEDYVEETQSDISSLFETRKAGPEPPSRANVLPSPSQVSLPRPTAFSKLPLKSLNDVLGIKKAPLGRTITTQSLYERQHSRPHTVESNQSERPAKRQRKLPQSNVHPRRNSSERLRNSLPIIDLEKMGDDNLSARSRRGPVSYTSEGFNGIVTSSGPSEPRTQPVSTSEKRIDYHKTSSKISPLTFATGMTGSENAPTNALQISSGKPRTKLIYSALLPHNNASKESTQLPVSASSMTSPDRHIDLYNAKTVSCPLLPDRAQPKHRSVDLALKILNKTNMKSAWERTGVLNMNRQSKGSRVQREATPLPILSHRTGISAPPNMPMENIRTEEMTWLPGVIPDFADKKSETASSSNMSTHQERRQTTLGQNSVSASRNRIAAPEHGSSTKFLLESTALEAAWRNRASCLLASHQSIKLSAEQGEEIEPWTREALYLHDLWPPGRLRPAYPSKEL